MNALPPLPERYVYAPDPLLGEGGMGRVLRAHDRLLDQQVAIKVVRAELARDPVFRNLFEREICAAARLAHPRIVPVHDVGELDGGVPYLALAFATGGSVASWVRAPRPWQLVHRMAIELLEALAFVHGAGALHRDIKPANILLNGSDGAVWLADLGLAGSTGELVRGENRTEGTPGYMAPEQASGRVRELGPASDLYAVGVVLWQLVTGRRPFGREHATHETTLPPLVPQPGLVIPDGLDRLLANLLAVDPLSRYDLAADVITELRALPAPSVTASSSPLAARPGAVSAPRAEASVSSMTSSAPADPAGLPLLELPTWNRPLPPPLPCSVPATRPHEPARASLRLFTLRDPPLVGHEAARQHLWDAARRVAESGTPHVVVVRGPVGSGRSHLVRSVTRLLHTGGYAEPVTLTYSREPSDTDGIAGCVREWSRPWNDDPGALYGRLLRRISRARGRLDNSTCQEAADLAHWALPEPDAPPVPDAVALRELSRRVSAVAWRGLSVLVLDDADHSQEPGDGLALARVWSRRSGVACLVIAVVGPEADLTGLDADVIDMPQLDRRASRKLLDAWLPLEPRVAETLIERCGGDAGLARDVVTDWAERGWLVARGPLFTVAPEVDWTAALPVGRDGVALARLETASAEEVDAHDVVDTVLMLSLTAPALAVEPFRRLCADRADAVLATGLVVQRGERVAFESARLFEDLRAHAEGRPDVTTLYQRLLDRSTSADDALDRGLWAMGAGDRLLACELLARAAEQNLDAGRLGRAETASQRMLQATAGREPYFGARGQAWLLWGRTALARGELDEAVDRLNHAERRLKAAQDDTGLAALATSMGELLMLRGDLAAAAGRLESAEELARDVGQPLWRVRACRLRAAVEFRRRNTDGAEVLYRRTESLAADRGLPREEAAAMLGQADVALSMGMLADADEMYEEARRSFERSRDPVGAVRAAVGRAEVLRQRGKTGPALKSARRAIERADRLGLTVLGLRARMGHAAALMDAGEQQEARALWLHVLGWAQSMGDFDAVVACQEALVWHALDTGDLAVAYRYLGDLGERLARAEGHEGWSRYRLVGAVYLVAAGNPGAAHGWLWDAMELGLGDRCDVNTARRLKGLASACEGVAPEVSELAKRALKRVVALSDLAKTGVL